MCLGASTFALPCCKSLNLQSSYDPYCILSHPVSLRCSRDVSARRMPIEKLWLAFGDPSSLPKRLYEAAARAIGRVP